MCGIFGILAPQPVTTRPFAWLAALNKARGNLAFGGLFLSETGEATVFRYGQPFEESLVPSQPAPVQLGHIRAPTGRRTSGVADVHPFAAPAGWLAHNGLLLNHDQFPHWRLDTTVTVDTAVILGGIQHHLQAGLPPPAAIGQTVAQLEGQQACWFWHKPEAALYLWRVMAPIYIGRTDAQVCFSSIPPDVPATDLLPEGVVFRVKPADMRWEACGTFPYYSPYRL